MKNKKEIKCISSGTLIEIKPEKKYMFIIESPINLSMSQHERITTKMKMEMKKFGLDEDVCAIIFEGGLTYKILEKDKEKKKAK